MSDQTTLETVESAEETPQKAFRRWDMELKLAKKREKDYQDKAHKIIKQYRGVETKANSFNILWANTEVLRPALYNSPPKPDVRRRFRQKDALGKAVSEVMERSLSYCVDAYDLDACLKADVLDALLPGRGLSRIRYIPTLKEVGNPATESEEKAHKDEAFEGAAEEVEYQQALCEHVQWDDYLQGPGKEWVEVTWTAYRCRLTKDDIEDKFGKEVADKITLNDTEDSDLKQDSNKDIQHVFKRAEFWEIWDKDGGKVFFWNESHRNGLIYPLGDDGKPTKGEPPLRMKGFFPTPCPLRMVEDTGTQVPTPLYQLYEEQAKELDRISARINKIVNALKIRGIYDSTLGEIQKLMDGADNTLIPVEQARAWMTNGGLDKAIWWMPTQQAAMVLKELYAARDLAKQVIYEITGISDIIRGVTNPNETLGAQKLKANSASLRLQRMQREVQRYTRDLIRMLAEVIGENFTPQTLAQMTGLQFPTAQQKQTAQVQAQAASAQQQPVPQQLQQLLMMPSWDEIMGVMQSDMQREYRVDVETDSTVADSLKQDMQGLQEVLTGIVNFWQGVGPAVERGAVSMDAVKAITMSIVRHARLGLEVEDALESGMQQPKPQDNGEAAKAQAEQAKLQQEQQQEQQRMAMEERQAQRDAQLREREMNMEAHFREREIQMEAAAQEREAQMKAALENQTAMIDMAFNRFKALLEARTKIEIAEISAGATLEAAQVSAAAAGTETRQ